ncbi:MAG TPA: AbrB/MazE/SpoVT family DNA-binding domain-containing protein [Chloroflexota bacterium]|nr:AbrB/MazE/SpoVT family DNA-binding domain-containing protein [Chloroflexota bacterium]
MALTATSNKEGRLTIPAEARAALHIKGETHWTIDIEDDALVLRPAIVVPREDAWAYTPEHAAKIKRAREDGQAGRVVTVTSEDLERIAALPDDEMARAIEQLRGEAARGDQRA